MGAASPVLVSALAHGARFMSVVCVPFRPDGPDRLRDLNWSFLRARWVAAGFDVFEADNVEGRFSCAKARNLAAARAGDWDVALIVDADCYLDLDAADDALELALETGGYVAPYDRLFILDEATTSRVRDAGYEPSPGDTDHGYVSVWPCAFAIARTLWDALGGMDDVTYPGVGYEDVNFVNRAAQLVTLERVKGDAYHLFHIPRPARLT